MILQSRHEWRDDKIVLDDQNGFEISGLSLLQNLEVTEKTAAYTPARESACIVRSYRWKEFHLPWRKWHASRMQFASDLTAAIAAVREIDNVGAIK